MNLRTNWTCPECGDVVPISLDALVGTDGSGTSRIKIRVKVPDSALADAFTHAWTHHEGAS